MGDQVAVEELDQCDWDDPLTRLFLLLEIANRPAWLRDVARSAGGRAAASRGAG